MTRSFDVVVIGGGPAGAAVANLVAKSGYGVALFERQTFPRFQVGESLIPAVNLTLDRLGVLDRLDGRGFPRKHAVQFFSPKGPSRPFYFADVRDPRMQHTWQVLRSEFDELLLDAAVGAGVDVATETEVLEVLTQAGGGASDGGPRSDGVVSGVRVRRPDGAEETVQARVVVDASGQRGLLAKRFGEREHIAGLENTSVYAHFRDVVRDTGVDAGSTLIFRLDSRSWLWFIPLPDVVSIGLVAPAKDIRSFGETSADMLQNAIAACEPLRERLAAAQRTTEVRAVRDYSYRASLDGGPGWLLVGDALGFIDPMYSTGLFLTMLSAELAAEAIDRRLQNGRAPADFAGYSERYQAAFDRFLVLVRAFYDDEFRFGDFARHQKHKQGLVDLLTGVIDSDEATEVTRAIQAWNEERTRMERSG